MQVVESKQQVVLRANDLEFRVTATVWSVTIDKYVGPVDDMLDRDDSKWVWKARINASELDARYAEADGSLDSMARQTKLMLGRGMDWVTCYVERLEDGAKWTEIGA
jgi:hypothetical protein